eukprot:Selendium_serpulae@DN11954_c0_g1_i1.p2
MFEGLPFASSSSSQSSHPPSPSDCSATFTGITRGDTRIGPSPSPGLLSFGLFCARLVGEAARLPTGDAARAPLGEEARTPTGDAPRAPTGEAARAPTGDDARGPPGEEAREVAALP